MDHQAIKSQYSAVLAKLKSVSKARINASRKAYPGIFPARISSSWRGSERA